MFVILSYLIFINIKINISYCSLFISFYYMCYIYKKKKDK